MLPTQYERAVDTPNGPFSPMFHVIPRRQRMADHHPPKLERGDNRPVRVGETLGKRRADIRICEYGMHASYHLINCYHANGAPPHPRFHVCLVELSGSYETIALANPATATKMAAQRRTVLAMSDPTTTGELLSAVVGVTLDVLTAKGGSLPILWRAALIGWRSGRGLPLGSSLPSTQQWSHADQLLLALHEFRHQDYRRAAVRLAAFYETNTHHSAKQALDTAFTAGDNVAYPFILKGKNNVSTERASTASSALLARFPLVSGDAKV